MGYRSEVGYMIRFDGDVSWNNDTPEEERNVTSEQLFKLFVTEAKSRLETKLCFEAGNQNFEVNHDKLHIKFYSDWSKWYETYEDVQCHEKLLDLASEWIKMQEDDTNMGGSCIRWGFVRIGEESGDVDERHDNEGYDLVYLTRGIAFD